MKKLVIHPKAREAIKGFPEDIKDKLGQALLDIQRGLKLMMPKSRPMPSVVSGAEELRVKGKDGIYRAFYYTRDERGILLFHAFVKKAQKTPVLEIELGRRRFWELLNEKN
jgi:phage-related protein